MTPTYSILPLLNALTVTRIDVVFTPTAHLEQKAWLGAAVRNRFLYACDSIAMPDGTTLREAFDRCPLPEDHFLYKQLCGGFPKAFVWDVSRVRPHLKSFAMEPDKHYTLMLYVLGTANEWIVQIKSAIRNMMTLGLGHNPVSLQLDDIAVHEPVRMESIAGSFFANQFADSPFHLTIRTLTPLSLMKNRQGASDGYQKGMNCFPSLYQIVRTSISRYATLTLLYGECHNHLHQIADYEEWNTLIDSISDVASNAWLYSANIKRVSLYSTPKQDTSSVYNLAGYIGELSFSGVDPMLVPAIKIMGSIGIGNDVGFGLGFYDAEVHRPISYESRKKNYINNNNNDDGQE